MGLKGQTIEDSEERSEILERIDRWSDKRLWPSIGLSVKLKMPTPDK